MKPNIISKALLLGAVAILAASPPLGAAGPNAVRVTLTVDVADVPVPSLRFSLFHDVLDQVPGNGALAYARAIRLIIQNEKWKDDSERCHRWLGQPLAELPEADVTEMLDRYTTALVELMKATRYESCDWQVPIRTEGVAALLPHLSELRSAARLLALDVRRCIRQGRFEDAALRLRAGLAMARHTGGSSLLIEGLVGVAITQQMLATVEDFIQQPGAPNLYWALTDLPPSAMTFWGSSLWERSFLYVHLPMLREIGQRPITVEDLRRALTALRSLGGAGIDPDLAAEEQASLAAAGLGWIAYPRARQALLRQGMAADQLDRLSAAEVLVRYIGGAYARQRDDFFKWSALPYPQARKGLAAAEAEMQKSIARDPLENTLARLVFPALGRAIDRFAGLDQQLAALRCLEALRVHAARHDRQWPAALDAIEELPVPADPITGLPFVYRLEGGFAILEPPLWKEGPERRPKIYEIKLRP